MYLPLYLSLTWFIIARSSTRNITFRYTILHIIHYVWKLVHFLSSNNDHQAGSLFITEKWTLFIFPVIVHSALITYIKLHCLDKCLVKYDQAKEFAGESTSYCRVLFFQFSSLFNLIYFISFYFFLFFLDFSGYKANKRHEPKVKWCPGMAWASWELEIKSQQDTAPLISTVWNSKMTI